MLALISIIFCINFVMGSLLYGDKDVSPEMLQGTYRKIVEDLVAVKKKFPESQATVYGVIDQVGQMHEMASESIKKCLDLNKKIREQEKKLTASSTSFKHKDLEFATLQSEFISLKNDLTTANQKLAIADKKFEAEKQQADKLLQEITKSADGKKVLAEDKEKQKVLAKLAKKEESKLVADAAAAR